MVSRKSHRRRRFARWALFGSLGFLFLVALLWVTPAMVASHWLWPRVLANLTADLDATVTTQKVSLGWFSPVVIQGVEVRDQGGQPALEIESVRTEATLLSLLWNAHDPRTVIVEQPTMTLVARDQGSNWEDILTRWLAQPAQAEAADLAVRVEDGVLDILDAQQTRVARLKSMQVTAELPAGGAAKGQVELNSCPLQVHEYAGTCAVRCEWTGKSARRSWCVSLNTRDTGLSLISLVARRFGLEMEADGALSADLMCNWDAETNALTVDARHANVVPLQLSAPAWLGQDTLRWKSLQWAGQGVLGNGRLLFKQVEVACDAGRFQLNGEIPWRSSAGGVAWRDLLASATSATADLDGQIDLANLARTFPRLLRIREGVTIESGNVHVVLSGSQAAAERRWTAHLETADLVAVAEGRRLTWDEPLQIDLEASQSDTDWQMQKLECRAPFLKLSGQGDPRTGSYAMTCDLRRLTSELRQVIDLGGVEATGTLGGQLTWRRDGRQMVVDASGTIEQLQLATPSGTNWREPRLLTKVTLEGELNDAGTLQLRGGHSELVAGSDRLELDLLEPVVAPGPDSSWVLGVLLRGEVTTWLARLQPWWPFAGVEGSGTLQVDSTVGLSAQTCDIRSLTLRAEPLRLRTPDLQMDEQRVNVSLTGQWDASHDRGTLADLTWQSTAIGLRANNVLIALHGARPELAGDLTFRADLQRLHDTWRASAGDRGWRVLGTAEGQVSLVQQADQIHVRWAVDMTDTELSQRPDTSFAGVPGAIPPPTAAAWRSIWQEPSLKFTGTGLYDATQDVVQFERCEFVAGNHLAITAAGRVAQPIGRCDVDLQGRARYDLAQLLPRIVATPSVRASGEETQEFWLRGPLFPAPESAVQPAAYSTPTPVGRLPVELCGLANLSWKSADMWGVPFGPGQLRARLNSGTVAADALELPLSGGTLRIAPRVNLNTDPPLVTCAPGQILTNIAITPAMCQNWLKYLTPLAADATRAEGQFGVTVDDVAVPLTELRDARVQGVLLVDSARLGPGPLSLQILQLVEQVRALVERRVPTSKVNADTTWVTIPRQDTRFQLLNGRVAHDQLSMSVGDTPIWTSGSVGLDQSLGLVVHLTIQESWVAKDPNLAWLKGTPLSIPVGGTLNQPRVDARALEQLSGQVVRQSAKGLIDQGIQRGLQELLGPPRK